MSKPLNLRLVQIHRQHAIHAPALSRFATSYAEIGTRGLSLPILPGIAVVRDYRGDPRGR